MVVSFPTDEQGNIIVHPLTGFAVTTAYGTAVIVALAYQRSIEEFDSGMQSLQLGIALTPQKALELAEVLTQTAWSILNQRAPPGTALQ